MCNAQEPIHKPTRCSWCVCVWRASLSSLISQWPKRFTRGGIQFIESHWKWSGSGCRTKHESNEEGADLVVLWHEPCGCRWSDVHGWILGYKNVESWGKERASKIERTVYSDDVEIPINPSTQITTSSKKFDKTKISVVTNNHTYIYVPLHAFDEVTVIAKVLRVQPPMKVSMKQDNMVGRWDWSYYNNTVGSKHWTSQRTGKLWIQELFNLNLSSMKNTYHGQRRIP